MFVIICEHSTYNRTESGKSWAKNPTEKRIEVISHDIYISNFSKPDAFMKALGGSERLYKAYTPAGYTCRKCVCVSPDKATKSEREFFVYLADSFEKKAPAEHLKAFED